MTESLSFELKLNYKPKNSHPERRALEQNLNIVNEKKRIEQEAFQRLTSF